MVREHSQPTIDRVEWLLEDWMGLTINRDKTRLVNLRDGRTSLDFLGYTFRYERDCFGKPKRYLHWMVSAKALQRERDRLREMTSNRYGCVPIGLLIRRLNRHLAGWDNYFHLGYPSRAYAKLDEFLRERLRRHLNRRSQRPHRKPEGTNWWHHLRSLGFSGVAAAKHDLRPRAAGVASGG